VYWDVGLSCELFVRKIKVEIYQYRLTIEYKSIMINNGELCKQVMDWPTSLITQLDDILFVQSISLASSGI
jgi:hypothetical protein